MLHSYRHPEHERELGAALETALPDVHVSLSHEVVGTFREFERAATTEVDAALSPLLGGYLRRLRGRCAERGLPEPAIMQSNGGLIDIDAAAEHAAWTVLSGPAGGAAGAAFVARSSGEPDALCFDMGGTSCDVCVVDGGAVQEQSATTIAGRPLALRNAGGQHGRRRRRLDRVARRRRRAAGRTAVGGRRPGTGLLWARRRAATVTDANLLLGRLRGVAGGISLDRGAAERAVASLASELGIDLHACAEGIVRVANAEMVRALRVVTVQRGIDPRRYALLAFGGAGPLHACAIADELGITRIVVPRASGVLAALGLVVSPRRRDVQRTVLLGGEGLTRAAIERAVTELGAQARSELGAADAELTATYELRYRGQAFELAVTGRPEPGQLREAFEALHEERYGYRDPDQELELVTVRVSATVPGAELSLGEREAGTATEGPAIVELPESTLLVAAGWSATTDRHGTIHLAR